MVKTVDDLSFYQVLQIMKVNDHSVARVTGSVKGLPGDGDLQIVGVPVQVTANPIIVVQGVRHFKMKPLGDSDYCHISD